MLMSLIFLLILNIILYIDLFKLSCKLLLSHQNLTSSKHLLLAI